jgi:hypothetical protein
MGDRKNFNRKNLRACEQQRGNCCGGAVESRRSARAGRRVRQDGHQPFLRIEGCFHLRAIFDALDGVVESVRFDGLEEIIDRVHFKSVDGVFVVGSDEDDHWQFSGIQLFHSVKPAESGHVNVEQKEIDLAQGEGVQQLRSVATFLNDFNIVIYQK